MSDSNGSTAMVHGAPTAAAGTVVRQEFGADQLARSAETATSALAAQAQAEVQARYIMAERRQRNILDCRSKFLHACKRPGFAKTARYKKPVGGGKFAEGYSVRFAEEAIRVLGNIHVSVAVIADDAEKRLVRVTVTDLECNASEANDVLVEKTVERKFLKDGQKPIRSRINSYGDLVHLVPATEDDLRTKQGAEVAKARRQGVIHLVPGDILDECLAAIMRTQADEDAADPDAAKKTVLDAFAGLGVKPSHLDEYLGHSLDNASPAEFAELRAVFAAIREGDATWPDVLAAKTAKPGDGSKPDPKVAETAAKVRARTENLKKGAKVKAPDLEQSKASPPHDEHGEVHPSGYGEPPGPGSAG